MRRATFLAISLMALMRTVSAADASWPSVLQQYRTTADETAAAVVARLQADEHHASAERVVGAAYRSAVLAAADDRRPNRVILIVDASASMREYLPDVAASVRSWSPVEPVEVGVVAFAGHALTVLPAAATPGAAAAYVDDLHASGGTLLGAAVARAAHLVLSEVGPPRWETMVVVTDGEASDAAMLATMLSRARLAGIRVHAVLVGDLRDHLLADGAHRSWVTPQTALHHDLGQALREAEVPQDLPQNRPQTVFATADLRRAESLLDAARDPERFDLPAVAADAMHIAGDVMHRPAITDREIAIVVAILTAVCTAVFSAVVVRALGR